MDSSKNKTKKFPEMKNSIRFGHFCEYDYLWIFPFNKIWESTSTRNDILDRKYSGNLSYIDIKLSLESLWKKSEI